MHREIFFPESLVPCLQHKNNLRVNKISLFLYLNRHVSLNKIHEKNSHKTVYIIIVRKCYLIKSYWYFISFHWSYSLLWSIKHQVLHILVLLLFQVLKSVNFLCKKRSRLVKTETVLSKWKYSIAPVPLGIGLGLNSSLVHILRSLFIQQVCGSVEIQGAAVQITDGYLSAKSLQEEWVSPWAPYHTNPISVVFEFCASDFSGPPELGNSNNSWVFKDDYFFFLKSRSFRVVMLSSWCLLILNN